MGEWGKKQLSQTGCPVVLVACKVHYDCMLTRTALVALGLSLDMPRRHSYLCLLHHPHFHFSSQGIRIMNSLTITTCFFQIIRILSHADLTNLTLRLHR